MKKQFALSLAANISRVVLGFVFFWQVTQALDIESLGEYLYVVAALGYFGTLIDYGFNLFVLNTASRSVDTARPLFLRVIVSKLVLTAISVIILIAIYRVAFVEQGALVTALFFVGLVLMSFSGLFIQFYKALGRFDHELSSTLLASALPVVLLFFIGKNITILDLAWIVLAVRLAVALFQLALFLRLTAGQPWADLQQVLQRVLPRAVTDIRANFKFAVFSVLGAVFLSVDLIVMRFMLGPEEVSIYGTAMKVLLALILFFDVLSGVFVPRLAKLHSASSRAFGAEVTRFALVMLSGAVFVSLGLLFLGPTAVTFAFGAEFSEAGKVLQVLSLVLVFRVMTMVSGNVLTINNLQGVRAITMSIVVPTHVLVNLFLQSRFGVWGAAYALAFSFLLLFALNTTALILNQRKQRTV